MTPPASTLRVVLIEDHPQYRETVELALGRTTDIHLIDSFGTAERALEALRDHAAWNPPDVILLDLQLPGMNGLEAIVPLKQILPTTKILVLTQSDRETDVLAAIARGASGYLLKSATVREILDSLRQGAEGGSPLDARIAGYILDTLRTKLPRQQMEDLLTAREVEVLGLLAEGLAKKEIAEKLGISPTTVVTHVTHIYEKLNVQNAPAAVAKAFGAGILPRE